MKRNLFYRFWLCTLLLWGVTNCVSSPSPTIDVSAQEAMASPEAMEGDNAHVAKQTTGNEVDFAEQANSERLSPLKETPSILEQKLPPLGKDILIPYFVHKGETLCTISQKIYGDAQHVQELAHINRLKNPNKIYAGDLVYYPSVVSTQEYTAKAQSASPLSVVVRKGDTLWSLSKQVLGSGANWRILWKMNPHIEDPHRIQVGMRVIFIPKETIGKEGKRPLRQHDLL